ncbi:SGNH/GDSL hydrolase family protein [Actinomycetospora endophytica]|uniref:SGNH/GDSL hydrolase family protein n=1 Tax=Actinomycetospora endophytica TaxID=2291215 RepID=A0ABS8P4V0_9PSEU|nr:SGNH/GDSL hydrolase family protein [Actinomycetospora endophytica]MCD2192575.1 SGNH/GDSL hydrolase family protein [Actinomycetospora endophytica]
MGVLVAAGAGVAAANPGGASNSPYVALGDSYTASPLTGTSAGPPPGCFRSVNNYPHLTAAALGANLTDASCSGATTKEFSAAQQTDAGTNPAQYSALAKDTKLVTVGIGGNDIGFSDIVKSCLSATPFGSPCKDRYTKGGTDQLRQRIDALAGKYASVLKEVHRRSPDARVALVGYPSVLPATGPGCFPAVPISPGDIAYLRGILADLNTRIQRSADAGDATFVDTYTSTVGHDICQVPGTKWIEGLIPTAPAAPVHPNAQGSAALSRAVVATLGGSAAAS